MREGEIVGRKVLVRWGTEGTIGVGAGVAVLLLRNLARIGGGLSVVGLVCGGLVVVGGLSMAARDRRDRALGAVTVVVGGLTLGASVPVIRGLAGPLLWIGGIGLLAIGGFRLFRFFRGLRTRR